MKHYITKCYGFKEPDGRSIFAFGETADTAGAGEGYELIVNFSQGGIMKK
jgi:hypothetical protein